MASFRFIFVDIFECDSLAEYRDYFSCYNQNLKFIYFHFVSFVMF